MEDGATSLTWIVRVVELLPPELYAVTTNVEELCMTVGVPLMTPVRVSNCRPVGRGSEIVQDVTVPPVLDGVAAGVNVCPFVRM
jgi:hypothetical protein